MPEIKRRRLAAVAGPGLQSASPEAEAIRAVGQIANTFLQGQIDRKDSREVMERTSALQTGVLEIASKVREEHNPEEAPAVFAQRYQEFTEGLTAEVGSDRVREAIGRRAQALGFAQSSAFEAENLRFQAAAEKTALDQAERTVAAVLGQSDDAGVRAGALDNFNADMTRQDIPEHERTQRLANLSKEGDIAAAMRMSENDAPGLLAALDDPERFVSLEQDPVLEERFRAQAKAQIAANENDAADKIAKTSNLHFEQAWSDLSIKIKAATQTEDLIGLTHRVEGLALLDQTVRGIDKRTAMRREIIGKAGDVAALGDARGRVQAALGGQPGSLLSLSNPDDREDIELVYTAPDFFVLPDGTPMDEEQIAQTKVLFATGVNQFPKSMENELVGLVDSMIPQNLLSATRLFDQIVTKKPVMSEQISARTREPMSMVRRKIQAGVTPEDAVAHVIARMTQSLGEVKEREAAYGERIDETAIENVDLLIAHMDKVGFFNDPPPTDTMLGDYDNLVHAGFIRTGDLVEARQSALIDVLRHNAITEVGGGPRWMSYAPEAEHRLGDEPEESTTKWVQNQLTLQFGEGARIEMDGQTRLQSPASYIVFRPTEDGGWEQAKDVVGFPVTAIRAARFTPNARAISETNLAIAKRRSELFDVLQGSLDATPEDFAKAMTEFGIPLVPGFARAGVR